MIGRIWHGWTIPENADVYENLLRQEIFPGNDAQHRVIKPPTHQSAWQFKIPNNN